MPKYDKTEKSNDTIYKSLLAERLSVTEPQDIEELAASLLYNSVKITPESFKNETGFGNAEQRNFVGMIARKENGGVSIERAGEILQEAYREDYPHLIDDTDANQGRNAIISLLSGVRTRKGINNYIKYKREKQAEEEYNYLHSQEEDYYQNAYHSSKEDKLLKVSIDEKENKEKYLTPEQEYEFNAILAENIDKEMADEYNEMQSLVESTKPQNYDENIENDQRRVLPIRENGDILLQEEETIQERRYREPEGQRKKDSVNINIEYGTISEGAPRGSGDTGGESNSRLVEQRRGGKSSSRDTEDEGTAPESEIKPDLNTSENNSNFATNKKEDGQTGETGLDNAGAMEGNAERRMVGRWESDDAIHRTAEACNASGGVGADVSPEEREELEGRGIDPDWDRRKFLSSLKAEAQKNGVWLDSSYLSDKGLLHDQKKAGTSENDVYLNKDGDTVTKLNNLVYVTSSDRAHNLSAAIDRIETHNKLFPWAQYKIIGFMDNKSGNPSLVLEQPYISEDARNATQAEIDAYLTDKGFTQTSARSWSNSHKVWSNGSYELFDARPANVLKGNDGKLYFIDVIPHSVEYMDAATDAVTGVTHTEEETEESNILFRERHEHSQNDIEIEDIISTAKENGTYLKAPNGATTNLTPKQWVQVRTKSFKIWFGDWEKATRIEKLRNSTPVEITGKEIKLSEDLREYKKNALEYGKTLRGEYANKDTNTNVEVNAQSIKEVLHHDYKDVEQIQSVAAIPSIIENGIYVDTLPNEDKNTNSKVKEYIYYVGELKIGGVDYTVKSVIAVDNNGNRYYDHKLTQIEKGKLLDELDRITNPSSQESITLSSVKDKRLLSILQTNSSKVVDENGEPMVVYHGTDSEFFSFNHDKVQRNGFYFAKDKDAVKRFNGGKYVVDAFLNIKKPLHRNYAPVISKKMIDIGDGVIADKISLNEEISTYVAFYPNQIKSATYNVGSFLKENDDIRFRKSETAAEVNHQFNEELTQQIGGKLPKGHIYQLGKPSGILQSAGIPNLPIELAAYKLEIKASSGYESNHPFELKDVINLPEAIANPIAVFDSKMKSGYKIILTELKSNGNNFVVAMQINAHPKGYRSRIEINDVRSVYPKDNVRDVVSWINRGDLLRWSDKTKLRNWLTQQRSNSAEVAIPVSEIYVATNIIENFENPTIEHGKIISEIENLSETLHTPIRIVKGVKEISDSNKQLEKRKRGSKGWFDTDTGEIVIVVPNNVSKDDARATLLHEAVAHYGLRKLFGEHFDRFLNDVYANAEKGVRERINALAAEKKCNISLATEEYIASLAETTNFERANISGLWQEIKDLFRAMLAKAGIQIEIGDNELRYILWRSYENLAEQGKGRTLLGKAADVTMQKSLKVGVFAEDNLGIKQLETENKTASVEIEAVNRAFNEKLKQHVEGMLPKGHVYQLGMPGAILQSAGIPKLQIELSADRAAFKSSNGKHDFDLAELMNLPKSLEDPLMIFDSTKKDGSKVILTELQHNGNNFVVVIRVHNKGRGRLNIGINDIRSIYPKDNVHGVLDWINSKDNLLLYADKKKALEYISVQSTNLAGNGNNNQELNLATNIIENFENPTIEEQENNDILFRDSPKNPRNIARDAYEKATSNSFLHRFSEAWEDNLRSISALQESIEKGLGRKVKDFEDIYKHALQRAA